MNETSPEAPAPRRGGQGQSTAAQLGQRLLRILAPVPAQRLSLHDAAGELLWLSRGEWPLGHQQYVQEAGDVFALEGSEPYLERTLDDGRRALFFCARTAAGEREGLAFVLSKARAGAETESEQADFAAIRARVFAAMRRFSLPRAPIPAPLLEAPADAEEKGEAAAPAAPALDLTPAPLAPIERPATPVAPLRSRPYARLRASGQTRRYEIAGGEATSLLEDLSRAERLISLLQRRSSRGSPLPASFALPLCAESVLTWDFLARLAPSIRRANLADGMLGFTVPAAAWERHGPATEHFLQQCGALGCFAALDDFNLAGSGFALLRAGAVRCVKLDAALTASILEDKFAHASVAACVKAARVLGLYCVAKGVKSATTARWLGSAGIDYAERFSRGAAAAATTTSAPALALAN
jgi:EAL domain-containing protein (putative c-di-GMP-specific phosphodiesterase class I)